MLNWFLYGALCVQTYIYSQYFHDKMWMQVLVYGLVLLETAQTAMVTNDAFQWFAYGFGDMIALSKPFTSSVDAPILDGLVALIVQLFFSWRIWFLSKSKVLSGAIGLVSVAQFVGALAGGINSIRINNVTKMQSSTVFIGLWFGGSALSDTLIAISMIILLFRHNATAFRGSDILRRIVMLTVETNTVTATAAIVGLIMWKVFPDASLFMAPAYAIGKLYSNTLLVIFNNRILRQASHQGHNGSLGSSGHRHALNLSMPRPSGSTLNHGVDIEIVKQTIDDSGNSIPLGERSNDKLRHDLALQYA
jgi:hypothetical protein